MHVNYLILKRVSPLMSRRNPVDFIYVQLLKTWWSSLQLGKRGQKGLIKHYKRQSHHPRAVQFNWKPDTFHFFVVVLFHFRFWLMNLHLLTWEQFHCTHVTCTNMVFDRQASKEQWGRHHSPPRVSFASINVILIFLGHYAWWLWWIQTDNEGLWCHL